MKAGVTARLLCVTLAFGFIFFGAARSLEAATYNWSFVGDTAAHSGSGTLETDVPVGPAFIIDFDGNFGGNAITALLAPLSFAGNDNKLLALSPGVELSTGGVAFTTTADTLNIFFTGGDAVLSLAEGTGVFGVFTVSDPLAETPIPAALPLFLSGLGALGLLARRRKRKNAVAA